MDHETTQVRPGDLITAQLFNTLIARIAELEARVGDGGTALLEVPRLVGLTLGQGQTLLSAAGTGFSVGSALDVFGAPLNPNTNASRALRVLNQVPPPGALASIAGAIDVVLAGTAGGVAPQPVPAPTLGAFSPIPVELQAELTIEGSNFGTPPSPLSVTIDGQNAAVDSLRRQDGQLVVTVPALVPAPPAGGRTVNVVVTAAGGTVSSNTLPAASRPRVIPASGTRPAITQIRDAAGAVVAPDGLLLVQGQMTIAGTNFIAGTGKRLIVVVSGTEQSFAVPAAGATAIQIVADVPRPASLTNSNPAVSGTLQVQAGNDAANRSVAVPLLFVLP